MMKKNGFTLAEVLITLAIIGVVATMTLPALMSNTQEQQAKTAYKKAINTLTEAVQTNLALEGYDFAQMQAGYGDIENYTETEMSLARVLGERCAVDFGKSSNKSTIATNGLTKITSPQVVYLRDGSALYIPTGAAISPSEYQTMQTDGLVKGFTIVLDINGAKAPNVLSNCLGKASGAEDTDTLLVGNPNTEDAGATNTGGSTADPTQQTSSCTKAMRVIKDQFLIKLRGNVAQPDGAAATWVYEN